MKRIAFAIICFVMSAYCAFAQITTNVNLEGGNNCLRWKVYCVRVTEERTDVCFEITALKNLNGLYVYNGVADFNNGNPIERDWVKINYAGLEMPLPMKGSLENGNIQEIKLHHGWGWEYVKKSETVYITLSFFPIPPTVRNIEIQNFTLRYGWLGSNYSTWNIPLNGLNNPRRDYTSFSSEISVKRHLDVNNDGICGIYEEVGGRYNAKYAVVKHNDTHTLIYLSDNSRLPWWQMGDIKATIQSTATNGLYKAIWIREFKNKNKNAYVAFDGRTMTVTLNPNTSSVQEIKCIKTYPTEAPIYEKVDEAIGLLKNENYQSAIKMLTEVVVSKSADNETRYSAYMLRAYAYRAMELYKTAIADYTSALDCKPGDEDAYYERGLLKLHLEDITGIDDLKRSGEFGRALLIEYDLLDYDTSKPIQKEQAPPLKKQSIPQLKKTNR